MKEITVAAEIQNIGTLTLFIHEALKDMNCGKKALMQISMAVDEIFSNIALYAYQGAPGEATVQIEEEGDCAKLTFIDSGIPYNPLAKEDPDTTLDAEKRAIGGLGIFLVKKTMDDMFYTRTENQNVLTILKKIR